MTRTNTAKADPSKLVAKVIEELKEHMELLNVVFVGRNRAEKLACSLVTESVGAIDAVVQQFDHDAQNILLHGLERAYSTIYVLCTVALTRVSGMATTNIR